MKNTIASIKTQNIVFIVVFVIHHVRMLLQYYDVIKPDDFAIMQTAIFLDFVLFLVPIVYVLNVHRRTFKLEANIPGASCSNRTSSYP